jgi:hypothetical protein
MAFREVRWPRCAAGHVAGVRRCGSTTASRVTSCRSTSVAWAWSSTWRPGRDRVVHALIFTAVFSRHCFVWLTHRQTTEAVIAGCEAAWAFFDGVFATLIPDDMTAIVDGADALENHGFTRACARQMRRVGGGGRGFAGRVRLLAPAARPTRQLAGSEPGATPRRRGFVDWGSRVMSAARRTDGGRGGT